MVQNVKKVVKLYTKTKNETKNFGKMKTSHFNLGIKIKISFSYF
jgi:hypothetical protein